MKDKWVAYHIKAIQYVEAKYKDDIIRMNDYLQNKKYNLAYKTGAKVVVHFFNSLKYDFFIFLYRIFF